MPDPLLSSNDPKKIYRICISKITTFTRKLDPITKNSDKLFGLFFYQPLCVFIFLQNFKICECKWEIQKA